MRIRREGPRTTGALRRGWRLFPRALKYMRPYRKLAVISLALTGVLAGASLLEPWPLAFIVDTVLGDKQPPTWLTQFVGSEKGALILAAVGASLLITLIVGLLNVVSEYVVTKLDQRMVLDFRSDLFQHAQRLSLGYHDDESAGMLMYRINNEADSIGKVLVEIPPLIQGVLTLFGM